MVTECKTCKHRIFDPLWGEFKCEVYQHRLYNLVGVESCGKYEKGEAKTSKKQHDLDEN